MINFDFITEVPTNIVYPLMRTILYSGILAKVITTSNVSALGRNQQETEKVQQPISINIFKYAPLKNSKSVTLKVPFCRKAEANANIRRSVKISDTNFYLTRDTRTT